MTTQFPWKLRHLNGPEIVFPEGARRYVDVRARPIASEGGIERYIDGGAVWTGDPGFNLWAVDISCSDQTPAPIAHLFPGAKMQIELPEEWSVPGPGAELNYDPVPGSIYGVNADDEVVGRLPGGSRSVFIPDAVAIRFRPKLNCIIGDIDFGGTQGRKVGQWSISLEELNPSGVYDDELVDNVFIDAVTEMPTVAAGEAWSFDVSAYAATNNGLEIFYSLVTEAPGLSINASTGVITWTAVPAGAHAVVFQAASGSAYRDGMVPVYGEKAPEIQVVWAEGTGGIVTSYTDVEGKVWRVHTFNAASSFVASKAGTVEALVVGGGGGAGYDFGGPGGAGGVATGGVVRCHVPAGSHPVVVGAGGAPGVDTLGNRYGRKGTDSAFRGLIGLGGGGGIGSNDSARGVPDGGCGGGDGPSLGRGVYTPGQGVNGQGYNGGLGSSTSDSGKYHSGGAGGAGGPGANFNAPIGPMTGGVGILSDITGMPTYYAGGGAGYGTNYSDPPPAGGKGGGGNAANKNGVVNTGGGAGSSGGATYGAAGGTGGSGVIIIRYRIS